MLMHLSKPLYANCVILTPDDKILCRSGERRMQWYLDHGLAEKVCDDPPTIRLNFPPAGRGDSEDPYMLADKSNVCVVCGTAESLTRHHVLPYCYRIHFSEENKSHTSYDILPVCVPCHEDYEHHARLLRKAIIAELRIEENDGVEMDAGAFKAIKAANAIKRHGAKIPPERVDELRARIMAHCGKTELTEEDIDAAAKLEWIVRENFSCASKKVVESQKSIDEFAKRWREHFVATMKPRHMPPHWRADRKMYDGDKDNGASQESTPSEPLREPAAGPRDEAADRPLEGGESGPQA